MNAAGAACSHQRERWHIRPEGASSLEPHSPSLSFFSFSTFSSSPLHTSLQSTLFLRAQRRSKAKRSRPPCRGSRAAQPSSSALITPWYNAIFLCNYSHINSFHEPLCCSGRDHLHRGVPAQYSRTPAFTSPPSVPSPPGWTGNLVGINST